MHYRLLLAAAAFSMFGLAGREPVSAASLLGVPSNIVLAVVGSGLSSQRPSAVGAFVALPLRNQAELENLVNQQSTPGSPLYHHFLTRQQFRDAYGPSAAALATVETALHGKGLATEVTSTGVYVSAQQATFESAFGIRLGRTGANAILVADRPPALPPALVSAGATVAGFGASRGFHPHSYLTKRSALPDSRQSNIGPYWFTDMKQAYEYPSFLTAAGRGRTIGIVGFQDFLDNDIKAYFAHEKIAAPQIRRRAVAGGPAAADPLNSGLTQELQLDIVMAGGSAPQAKLITYLGPTPNGNNVPDEIFVTPFIAAVEDNTVDVLTTSFGGCEADNLPGILRMYHDIFLQGNAQGITFIFSSGDSGALGCGTNTATLGVEYPASDPSVTGVGGSVRLETTAIPNPSRPRRSDYVHETSFAQVFNTSFAGTPPGAIWGSGGGISQAFSKPSYQNLVATGSRFRTVPDLSMQMGGFTCDNPNRPIVIPTATCVDGSSTIVPLAIGSSGGGFFAFVGTSSSAPQFAGLLALQEQLFGNTREGNANNLIYALAATPGANAFHTNILGNNGYPTHPGYNYVLGNGTVRAAEFVLRRNGPLAGDPWTSSNP